MRWGEEGGQKISFPHFTQPLLCVTTSMSQIKIQAHETWRSYYESHAGQCLYNNNDPYCTCSYSKKFIPANTTLSPLSLIYFTFQTGITVATGARDICWNNITVIANYDNSSPQDKISTQRGLFHTSCNKFNPDIRKTYRKKLIANTPTALPKIIYASI